MFIRRGRFWGPCLNKATHYSVQKRDCNHIIRWYNVMTMWRKCEIYLQDWKDLKDRKPLILQGARQVGKTYLVKEFGAKSFSNLAYFNFETTPGLNDLFAADLRPHHLIKKLKLFLDGMAILPQKTLIFFDEIQQSERAVTSLKYFCEEAPEFAVIAAGSLLGIKLNRSQASFPVGKVTLKSLYPLSYSEYLKAAGLDSLLEVMNDVKALETLEPVFHQRLLEEFKVYLACGGMPEAIQRYLEKNDFSVCREIQNQILSSYELDFSKHAGAVEGLRISQLWNSIPSQISKENERFFFSAIKGSARAREYEGAVQWLIDAGLVIRSSCIKSPLVPLSSYVEQSLFKLFFLDAGLLAAKCKISSKIFTSPNEYFTHFKGALLENAIAQELTAHHMGPLHYWKSKANAEVDFLLQLEDQIIPIEVKSGMNRKSKSLNFFREKYKSPLAFKLTPGPFLRKGSLIELPIYAAGLLPKLVREL